jgi:C1A family cysteine protease
MVIMNSLRFFELPREGRVVSIFLFAAFFATLDAFAQNAPAVRRATGLRPPNPAELNWMEQNLVKVGAVHLNQLAVDRVNSERRRLGQVPMALNAVPHGAEVMPWSRVQPQTVADGTPLPPAVDNSALPSFPPVRNQGEIGSCASFSTTYYVGTHMLGLARGWNNRNEDNSLKLSPKWTYAMVNDGEDNGSWFTETIEVLRKHGGATWADWPYSGANAPSSYREWARSASVWRNAVNLRTTGSAGTVENINTVAGLQNLKRLLANGYVLLYATDIYGWQYVSVGDDPSTTADDAFVGERAVSYIQGESSGHAMTVVGYNDDIWIDINKNGVVDLGEKGAVKICNSWGADWQDGNAGFMWIAYDALRTTSAVAGAAAGQVNRAPGSLGPTRTPWWNNAAYYFTALPAQAPRLLAQFTLNHRARAEMYVRVGVSSTTATTPANYFQSGALQGQGGRYAFDGTTTAGNGTFVFDLSDIAASGLRRYYLEVSDNSSGNAASVSDFRLTDAAGQALAVAVNGVPGSADNSTRIAYVDYSMDAPVITSATTASGSVGRAFTFSVIASSATNFSATGLPGGLIIASASGVISGTPTAAGTFVVNLSARSSAGTGTGVLTLTIAPGGIVVPPGITSPSGATGTVGVAFSYTITASNSPTSFGAVGLPRGLSFNSASGVIAGVPTESGNFAVNLSADNAGGTGQRVLALLINPPALGVPVITSAAAATFNAGSPFNYRITALNSPTRFGAVGLPSELTFDTTNGVIYGTPSLARQYAVTLSATNPAGVGYLAFTLTVLGDSSFGPANDNFSNRALLVGTNVTVTNANLNATAQPGEPAHAGATASHSVWWTWTAPGAGVVTVNTLGSSFDTVLAVYTGSIVTNLTSVASNDDANGQRTSSLTFNATAGAAYQLAVDGYGGAVGTVVLNLSIAGAVAAPPNDDFANAIVLTGSSVATTGRNSGATAQTGEPAHAGSTASHSVWWTWTAPSSGTVIVNTVGSDFDTVLAVYTGANVASLTPVASDDQGGGNNTSRLIFTASAGTIYRIAVDGYFGAAGNIALSLQQGSANPGNDAFANAIVLSGATVTATGNNTNATGEVGEPAHAGYAASKSVWWTWTAPINGRAQIDTIGSGFDTVLAIYTGSSLASLTLVDANDDAGGAGASKVVINVTAGTVYRIAVDGYAGREGAVTLNVAASNSAPANDNFANRAVLVSSRFSTNTANANATAELNEPSHAGNSAAKSLWWTWTAPVDGRAVITTAGSAIDTVLAVYTGTSVASLVSVASNDDARGTSTSMVAFTVTAGTAYQIAVDGFSGATGDIVLSGSVQTNVLYATDFELFRTGSDTLVGSDGWVGFPVASGVSGVIGDNGGQVGFLGYNAPPAGSKNVYVFPAVNFQPLAAGRPIVSFSADVAVYNSTNASYDRFAVMVFNSSSERLADITLDNSNLKIFRGDGTGAMNDTGVRFSNAQRYTLSFTADFAANTWSASLDAIPLFSNQPFNSSGAVRDLSDVDFMWNIANTASPGNNFLVFDNYLLSAAAAATAPVITKQPLPLSVAVGGLAVFEAEASGAGPLRFQWRLNGTNLVGQTNASLSLLNVTTNDAGSYSVAVSNFLGAAFSQVALLTVTPRVPSALFGAPVLDSRGLQFQVTGTPGRTYHLEVSPDLRTWTESTSMLNQNGTLLLTDPGATNTIRKFYRMRESDF